jgi:malate synthase
MAAQVPNRRDPDATAAALDAVRRDKERELALGHDGTWVAHPDLVPVALRVWEEGLRGVLHQREVLPAGPELELSVLFAPPPGVRTPGGVREAARTALRYWAAWLDGNGCVALDGKMEDAATAEISVALLWHWLHRGAELTDGTQVTAATIDGVVRGETEALIASGSAPRAEEAADLVLRAVIAPTVTEFVLSEAYSRLRRP